MQDVRFHTPPPADCGFRSRRFLQTHIREIMGFYYPQSIDTSQGGFYQAFRDDGSVYDARSRHLVSSTRMIFNYAMAAIEFGNSAYLDAVRHGLKFLREKHLNPTTGGYRWLLDGDTTADATNHCYGLAFVLLAYSSALKAGIQEAAPWIEETYALMERHFWDADYGLYRDEISADWNTVAPYRGQNANMHSCEAMIAAFEATSDKKYLERAMTLAQTICQRQAALADGLIWEHYDAHWQVDWDYNKADPKNLYRPWGFQPGHLTEWAKLLLMIERHQPADWLLPCARRLFDTALSTAWDQERGGIYYGFAPDGRICDDDKYFWVQAESMAAAALLAERTGDANYWRWYERLWDYSWEHMIDHRHGAWFRLLDADNQRYDDIKSPPGGKCDYHSMGACHEVLRCNTLKA
ncbi:N-acylglucosamine 2-epimerase [Marinobacterium aestuarii]|uniref:N-acylglucosamine 2-epimerase n=1 Tax=Marinobacterium aestuarii TaxID=1821621 RepID=A0A1A9F3I6_9GAMM|nr:AGE family epimerase/isomerase [Marinobacterium aestuarii]ANG64642.1 N-acylglucosamine 2-epimerase [Marinobacterium aestuarii]